MKEERGKKRERAQVAFEDLRYHSILFSHTCTNSTGAINFLSTVFSIFFKEKIFIATPFCKI